MAGLYVHIPLCASRCYYCDFYSSTFQGNKDALIDGIAQEMCDRKDYLRGELVTTVYLGGGTPSMLSADELGRLFDVISSNFPCDFTEVTIEANPEDLTKEYLHGLRRLPVNRLSIGVQSFSDDELKSINRRHTAQRAIRAVRDAQESGLENISIDLIYGLPNQTLDGWMNNVRQAIALQVPHVSAYSLTFEEHSMLTKMRDKGVICEVDEELSLAMFKCLRKEMADSGILPYEISNFARKGYESQHNSSYWNYVPYIGVGPSAHSFDGNSRRWNVANTREYLRAMNEGRTFYEEEVLDLPARYNEYVMTSLRKSVGIHVETLAQFFSGALKDYFCQMIRPYVLEGKVVEENGYCRLSEEGIFISDYIIEDLLYV